MTKTGRTIGCFLFGSKQITCEYYEIWSSGVGFQFRCNTNPLSPIRGCILSLATEIKFQTLGGNQGHKKCHMLFGGLLGSLDQQLKETFLIYGTGCFVA